jgi:hypothetical protein
MTSSIYAWNTISNIPHLSHQCLACWAVTCQRNWTAEDLIWYHWTRKELMILSKGQIKDKYLPRKQHGRKKCQTCIDKNVITYLIRDIEYSLLNLFVNVFCRSNECLRISVNPATKLTTNVELKQKTVSLCEMYSCHQ